MSTMTDGPNPGFWAGYRVWLGRKKHLLLALMVLVAIAFALGLWAVEAPQDPFAYDEFR